jgi:DNA invertase Pin-like site-specific DNA recombinase
LNIDPDPDIVEVIIRACKERGLDPAAALEIETHIRTEYGGLRVRIPKRKKNLTAHERSLIIADGVSSMSTSEITAKHSISRASLYRLMKKGGM